MDDLNTATIQDDTTGSSPDASVASPVTAESSPADTATPLPGESSAARDAQPLATTDGQVTVDPIDEALKALPSAEELEKQAGQGIQYAKALSTFRPIVESHRQLTEQFTPWQPIVEQYQNPAELQPVLELSNSLFGKTRMSDDGQIVPDTSEFVEMIHKDSPHRLDQIIVDGLLTKTVHNGVEDTRLEHLRKHMGWLLPSEVPVGAVDQSDLQNIKPEYREVFQKLAPETQEMLINGSELARDQFLQRELSESNRLASEAKQAQENEVKFFQEAQEAGYQAVVTGYGETLNSIVDDIFKNVSNDSVTLTGNKETDTFLKGLVGATLVNLTDPVKRPLTEQHLGIKIPAELDKRATDYEDALSRAVIAEKYGDNAAAKELRRQANAHAQWLRVKGHEIGAQALSNLSKILGFSYETQNNLLGQAQRTRPVVPGTPVNPANPNQASVQMPDAAPFSQEWIEQTTRQFVRT